MVLLTERYLLRFVGWSILVLLAWRAAVVTAWGVPTRPEAEVLMDVKAAIDPHGEVLKSWRAEWQPCTIGAFEGVLCDSAGRVSNISLRGRALSGFIPDALSELASLSGLFLHFNSLRGGIPASLSTLTGLTELYLNWNQLSSAIPPQLGLLSRLQVLQLSCNKLEGEIPAELAGLGNLETLAVNANNLNGSIPDAFGNMTMLARLDVSNNSFTGAIPADVANLSHLVFLDVSANSLSGPVPTRLFGLPQGFGYRNNSGLCGMASDLAPCPAATPTGASPPTTSAPTVSPRRLRSIMSIVTAVVFAIGGSAFLLLVFICLRRRNAKLRTHSFPFASSSDIKSVQKLGVAIKAAAAAAKAESFHADSAHNPAAHGTPESNFSILGRSRVMSCRSSSTIASTNGLPSPTEWSSWIHLDELETATNYFSEKNLLRKNCHAAVYRGALRDGTAIAVKAIYNTRYSLGEHDFQSALEALMQVKHDNLVKFLGFCCSKGGSECFLVYAFVPDASSLEHQLHGPCETVLSWSTRVKIIRGIARGLAHLHEGLPPPLAMVHQNLCASNILLDTQCNPLLADYGLADIMAEEVMYSTHKTLASLGYLAPEYAYLGHVTETADVYAFGALTLELLTGRRVFVDDATRGVSTAAWVRASVEGGRLRDVLDARLESARPAGMAVIADIALECVAEQMAARPRMKDVVRRLHSASELATAIAPSPSSAPAPAPAPSALRTASFHYGCGCDALHHCR